MTSAGADDAGGSHRPRHLALHIPNSHPRSPVPTPSSASPALTPRLSDAGLRSNVSIVDGTGQQQSAARQPHPLPNAQVERPNRPPHRTCAAAITAALSSFVAYFQVRISSGESSRDFLARERTFFSWLRLSTLLGIASIALYLRLRLKTSDSPNGDDGVPSSALVPAAVLGAHQHALEALWTRALRRQAARRRLLQRSTSPPWTSSVGVPAQLVLQHPVSSNSDSDGRTLDENPLVGKVAGSIFFALAILTLLVGWLDYMHAERALERADEDVGNLDGPAALTDTQLEPERQRRGGGGNSTAWHNAKFAKEAHSGRVVHAVSILIALVVALGALLMLVSGSHAHK
ncbi:hypothetical protein FA10DRAFT_287676 [Acaromyces ingoldii]|uniref:DUF202 domain-containing protein n=1 Tax=Acaromyces ingoldii TaxID=215250 RepID=A0A316YEX8_9BASI|nr:hypothetical protein FA10DRAFT_287676 [Acaromyces ingoldii]PWN88120.1 hypothetical protein FA10DRAFT_287676 [Acaromyces ingoldii]